MWQMHRQYSYCYFTGPSITNNEMEYVILDLISYPYPHLTPAPIPTSISIAILQVHLLPTMKWNM